MRLYFLLLLFLLTACGQDKYPEPLYNLENLSIKLIVDSQDKIVKNYSIPMRSYEKQSDEMPYFVTKSDEDISFFITIYDKSGNLSEEGLLEITQNTYFECKNINQQGSKLISNKTNTYDLSVSSGELKYIDINCSMRVNYCPKEEITQQYSCEFSEREYTKEGFLYPGSISTKFWLLPENPLDEIIPMLNELGYSPYNNYRRDASSEVHDRVNFDKKRDKFDLGFININQEGPYFFWDENGITNIVFSLREYRGDRPHTNDSERDLEGITAYISKLTDIDPEHFQKTIICRYWHYSYEEGTEMEDLCLSEKYRYGGDIRNLSNKFKLSDTYDNSFNMFSVSISLK
jgi:hypothetical protein